MLASQNETGSVFCFCSLEEIIETRYEFFFKYLGEFTCEPIWATPYSNILWIFWVFFIGSHVTFSYFLSLGMYFVFLVLLPWLSPPALCLEVVVVALLSFPDLFTVDATWWGSLWLPYSLMNLFPNLLMFFFPWW